MKRLLPLLILSVAAPAFAADIDTNQTIIVINGEEIKASEYYTRMEFMPEVGRLKGGGLFEKAPPGLMTLQMLIEERLTLLAAKERGVYPTDAQTKAVMQSKIDRDPGFLPGFTATGLTQKDLEYQCLIEAAQFNLITMGITITDMEVEKHYADHPTTFTTSRRMKLSMIAVSADKKDQVDAALKSGTSFTEVAKQMSEDLTKNFGGALGEVSVDEMTPAIKENLEKVKIGQTTEWIEGKSIFVKFLKEDVIPAKVMPLDDPLRKMIRRNLMLDRGTVKNDLEKILKETRSHMKIELKIPRFKSDFDRFMKEFLGS